MKRLYQFLKEHIVAVVTAAAIVTTAVAVPVTMHYIDSTSDKDTPGITTPAGDDQGGDVTSPTNDELDKLAQEQADKEKEQGLLSQQEQESQDEKEQQPEQKEDNKQADTTNKVEKEDKQEDKKENTTTSKPSTNSTTSSKPSSSSSSTTTKPNNSSSSSTSSSSKPSTGTSSGSSSSSSSGSSGNSSGSSSNSSDKEEPSGPVVVQMADPTTGISWDGKSAIVYIYPDGTTGTTPKHGATYEQVPGMTATYEDPNHMDTPEEIYNCPHCGKVEGDGANGTCLRYWTGGTHDCPHCGESVPVKTCHTCK